MKDPGDYLVKHPHFIFAEGREHERERITVIIENRICFDNKEGRGCDHSACYEMRELITIIGGTE